MARLARQIFAGSGALALSVCLRLPAAAQGPTNVEESVSETAEISDTSEETQPPGGGASEGPSEAGAADDGFPSADDGSSAADDGFPSSDDGFPSADGSSGAESGGDYEVGPSTDYYGTGADTGEQKRDLSLLYTGLGTFLGSYALSGIIGQSLYDKSAQDCSYCDSARIMWVPVAGPWLVFADADDGNGRAAGAAMGIFQVGGLALLIAGIIDTVKSGKKGSESNVALHMGATASSANARLDVRF